ncbi:MAG: SGNH/GDSL hydrolase family protein [Gammaproteobacteria bacterium]
MKTIQNLLLLLASTLVALLLAEGGLRMAGMHGAWFTELDPDLGWRLQAGVQGWHTKEGNTLVTINSEGMRDRERSKAKPDDVYRIALLGDSFIEGLQVHADETLNARLEQQLSQCDAFTGTRVQVLNFGVSGYGAVQAALAVKYKAADFSPDLAVLGFDTVNDVRDSYRPISPQPYRPFLIENTDGSFSVDNSFRDTTFYRSRSQWHWNLYYKLLGHSRLLQLVKRLYSGATGLNRETVAPDGQPGKEEGNYQSYLPPTDEQWHAAWRHSEAAIELFQNNARASGAKALMVVLGTGIQIHPDPDHRSRMAARFGVADWLDPDRRLLEIARNHDLPALSLTEPMREAAEQGGKALHYLSDRTRTWGHWNALGHATAARILGDRICAMRGANTL